MDFRRTVIGNVREGPSHYQGGHDGPEMANLHDAMYLYAMALNRTLARHGPIFDARDVIRNARRVSFKGRYTRLGVVTWSAKMGFQESQGPSIWMTKAFGGGNTP